MSSSICFLHPDLGIGGAERLVVDAALGLQHQYRHNITIYTSHHSHAHCFPETSDGTLSIKVFGDFFPTSPFGKFKILFSILRQFYLTLRLLFNEPAYDIYIIDQLSFAIPLIRFYNYLFHPSAKILFYCHFPDLLLTDRTNIVKSLYRLPIDYLEQFTTSFAHKILVNSNFTKSKFHESFEFIHQEPIILYPAINFTSYDSKTTDSTSENIDNLSSDTLLFTSINRFERKKNIGLAIKAFAMLKSHSKYKQMKLMIAGGYDRENRENVEHYPELKQLAIDNGLTVSDYPNMSNQVIFLRSFTHSQRTALLTRSIAIVYTPSNEHFGIVPIESMYAKCIVIAINNGGPTESILNGETGYLCEETVSDFAKGLESVVNLTEFKRKAMGEKGRERVIERFSLKAFTDRLNAILMEMKEEKINNNSNKACFILLLSLCAVLVSYSVFILMRL